MLILLPAGDNKIGHSEGLKRFFFFDLFTNNCYENQ